MDDSSDVVIIESDADETDIVKKHIKKAAPEVETITEVETSEEVETSKPVETSNAIEATNGIEEINDVEASNEAGTSDEVDGNKEVEASKKVEASKEAGVTNENVDDIDSKCVNGTDLEEKKESPAQSPCEIENMTVVDEDVDLISSDEEEKEKEKEKEKVKVEETKPKENEKHRKSSKRRHNDSESSSSSKKRSSRSDSKSSNHNDAEVKKPLPLLEKYWKAVKDDPTDFTGWTYLLQYVDQANDIAAASEVYDDFLSRYPYCYGYWRKYADYLKKNGEKAKCEEIFEKGVKAIPLSVDLWIHYLNYMKEAYSTNEELVRNLFERSLKSCGLEFRSDRLWDAYVKWEIEGNRLLNVTSIFDRWLAVPTQGYVTVMEKFKEHVKKNPPNKILDPEEFFSLRNEVLNDTKASHTEMESKLSDDAPPGEEAPEHLDKMNEEETKALKEKIISTRKERHKVTQKDALARWSYEENIKRPYFHVKPLEQCQLNNWKEYLDYEIKEGKSDRIILLFERCLIACALYEEFWIKFIEYLLAQPEVLVEKVREVFVRACTIHHTKKINIHLRWSAFEETYGNSLKAAQILEDLEKLCPNVLVVMLRRINIVRRRGEYEKVCAYYEQYIEANANKKEIASSLAIKYARFCCKILNDSDKGVEVLKSAIEKNKDDNRLKLQLIDIYMSKCPVEFDEIVHLLDSIINATEDSEKKLLFAQRKLEFLEEFAEECTPVQKAQEEYESLLKVVAEKKKAIEEKKIEAATKKNGAGEQSQQPTTVAYSTANPQTYYQTAPPPTYQTYPQGYVAAPYQQQPVYAPTDPNYGYQNWQSYGTTYNQQWPSGTTPQAGATSGYNYMY